MTAMTPKAARTLPSPLGPFKIEVCSDGLTHCGWIGSDWADSDWTDSDWTDSDWADTDAMAPTQSPAGTLLPLLEQAEQQFHAYFAGHLQHFDLPLAPGGTPFQQQVWQQLLGVPYGHTKSYGDIAKAVGRATAARAVGAAVGRNPLAIIVPCHRIVGANGALTGFASGLDRKRWLLALETARD